jgi:hypothetical protein
MSLFSLLATGQLWAINELEGNDPFNNPTFFDNPEPKISIFPNPTTDFFEIQSSREIDKIVVFNLIGRELKSFNAEVDRKYSVGDLPNGMYLVQVFDENNKVITTQRLQKR